MIKSFLLIVPLISLFFNLEVSSLPKIHLALYDFIIPILFLMLVIRSPAVRYEMQSNFKEDLVMIGLILLGVCLSFIYIPGGYFTLLKDMIKVLLFIMGLIVYKFYFENWDRPKNIIIFPILALMVLYIINSLINDGCIYLTAFAFYIFLMWLLCAYLFVEKSNSELMIFLGVTICVLYIFLLYRRLEILALMGISLSVFVSDRYSLSKKQIISLGSILSLMVITVVYFYKDVFAQSLFVRLPLWKHALQLGIENFPFGIGLGQYQAQQLMPEAHQIQGARCTEFQYPHNQFLYWFAEMGVVGLLLGLAFIKLLLNYLSPLKFVWKYSIFFMLIVISCTHDVMSLRSLPIFLALVFTLSRTSAKEIILKI